jgi:hypothetical protein
VLLTGASVGLIPWIVLLAITLPHRYVASHWTVTWVGFDIVLLGCLAPTAWLAWRRLRAPAQLLIPPGHHHHRAFSQESVGNGEADAGRAPGDQRVLAL